MSSGNVPAGRLEGKTAVVTGGGSGIGRATALLFAREGARVVLANRRAETGQAVAQEIERFGGTARFVATDVTDPDQVERLFAETEALFGPADILVNVAGISGRRYGDGPIHQCTETGWDQTLTANLRSVFLTCRAATRRMIEAGGGCIINTSSVLGFSPSPHFFATHAYAASKGAIIALSQAMASYYAPYGIRVNVLAPGLIATPMSRRAQNDPSILAFIRTKQPLTGTLGTPEDCAYAALYLASEEARFVTGVVLPVDGGWRLADGQIPPKETD